VSQGLHSRLRTESSTLLDELFGDCPNTRRPRNLISRNGAGVNFRSWLVIQRQHVKTDAGRFCGLPILSWEDNERFTKSPKPIRTDPSKDGCEAKTLVGLQFNKLCSPSSFDVRKQLDKRANSICPLPVKFPLPVFPAEVVELTLTRPANPLTSRDFTCHDLLRVLRPDRDVII